MENHSCDREKCPPTYVSGPKSNCFLCKKLCYFQCYGLISGVSLNYYMNLSTETNADKPFTPMSNIQFICSACVTTVNSGTQMPAVESASGGSGRNTPNSSSKVTMKSIMTELSKMQGLMENVQATACENNKKLNTIDAATNEIRLNAQAILKKTDMPNQIPQVHQPNLFSPLLLSHGVQSKSSYSAALRTNTTPINTPKRRRDENESMRPTNVPKPKVGTRVNAIGLSVVRLPTPKPRNEIRKFEKAIWISRLNPSTTPEEILEYISANTAVTDVSKLNCHKLVKKDRDLSTLSFVSFKIEMNTDDFNILCDPSVWHEGVMVREFLEVRNRTLGAFLLNPTDNGTDLNGQRHRSPMTESNNQSHQTTSTELMDTQEVSKDTPQPAHAINLNHSIVN